MSNSLLVNNVLNHMPWLVSWSNNLRAFVEMLKVVDEELFGISKSNDLYVISMNHRCATDFLDLNAQWKHLEKCDFEKSTLDVYAHLFIKHTKRINYLTISHLKAMVRYDLCNAKMIASDLNMSVDRLRFDVRNKPLVDLYRTYLPATFKNYISSKAYIDSLFAKHARLLVLRLDFGYHRPEKMNGSFFPTVGRDQLLNDRDALIRYFQTDVHERGLIGYFWKIEWQPRKGFHIHTMLFMDGAKVRSEAAIGEIIGEHWKVYITEGQGYHWNCNLDKKKYGEKLGIGMINASDENLITNLKSYVLSYITKPDYLVRIIMGNEHRLFGRSCKKLVPSRMGRPRKNAVEPTSPQI